MKKIFIIFLIMMTGLFAACELVEKEEKDPLQNIEIEEIYNYDFENDIEIESIAAAQIYCIRNIKYIEESADYWQLPEETYQLKTGDCEDFAIFFMYLLKIKLNIDSQLVLIKSYSGDCHVLVFIEETNMYYETMSCFAFNNINQFSEWRIIWYCPYPEVIWMTYYYHDNVGKYL